MAELWLPEEERRGLWDPLGRQLRVIGWRPGPAGVSVVELAPGLVVAVDHAMPTTLTEVVVPVDGAAVTSADLRLLEHLLGDDAAAALASMVDTAPPDRLVALPAFDRRWEVEPQLRGRSRDGSSAMAAFTRLVLAADLADDAALDDNARAVATLEAAATDLLTAPVIDVDRLRAALPLLPSAVHHRNDLAGRLRDLFRQLPVVFRAPLALDLERTERAVDDAAHDLPAAALRSIAAAPAAAAAPPGARAARPMKEAAEELAFGARPPLEVRGDHHGWAWLDAGGNVAITAPSSAAGAWGRVFRRQDGLLLGLAPMRKGSDQLDATVLVPPVNDPSSLVVELVDDPASLRHHAVRQAILTGRRAAHLSRIGDPRAEAEWLRCADQWRALDDIQRANLAVRHAQRSFDVGKGVPRRSFRNPATDGPLLADLLR